MVTLGKWHKSKSKKTDGLEIEVNPCKRRNQKSLKMTFPVLFKKYDGWKLNFLKSVLAHFTQMCRKTIFLLHAQVYIEVLRTPFSSNIYRSILRYHVHYWTHSFESQRLLVCFISLSKLTCNKKQDHKFLSEFFFLIVTSKLK